VGCGLSKAHIRPEVLVFHGNARTTVHGRKLIVARHAAGWPKAHIAAAMGISRKCVRTWITRFESEGEAGLQDRSSRPYTSPTRTPVEVEDRIVATRTQERRGPDGTMAVPTPATPNGKRPTRTGCTAITITAATPHSAGNRRPAASPT
jgi:hypothetical protein